MSKRGGPAFPVPMYTNKDGNPRPIIEAGMTLRDYFAGQALAGMLANSRDWDEAGTHECAASAYRYADAMLAERGAK